MDPQREVDSCRLCGFIFLDKRRKRNIVGDSQEFLRQWSVWREVARRCVHCNLPIVPMFGGHSCVARATVICISWKVSEVVQRSRTNNK